ncbi:REP-associated tyrosine transposase [Pontibacter lucknowensis]|uniref:REP element-mobilizing transposase RayT n=1 Tax=Pontibacter lucknowensis TaxID=1077936 RepID=A0A1N6W323_9BACT|nr:transposase [Pontibacter lucknowensis]SIQ84428.1 REP element-mobilizing transposase RayT [Pontibacter lucknowensis]
MSEYRKAHPDELYFVTMSVVGWLDVFTRNEYKDIVIDNLRYCQQKEGLEVFAYVIMTNHLHLIVRRRDKELTELLGRFKSFTAKKIIAAIENNVQESRREWLLYLFRHFAKVNKQYVGNHFWQYSSHPTLLDTPKIMEQKEEYIHMNPVRAGIVNEPQAYVYSSACADSPLKVMEM